MIMNKLTELFPDFDSKNYKRDLESHLIYKNDENSFLAQFLHIVVLYPCIRFY